MPSKRHRPFAFGCVHTLKGFRLYGERSTDLELRARYHSKDSQLMRGSEKLYSEIVAQSTNDKIFAGPTSDLVLLLYHFA
eukprot:1193941-Prorocentrum_minimum.AAC.4